MCTWAIVLVVFGAALEFLGIFVIAFPDLLDPTLRLSRWLDRRTRIVVNRVRRLLRLPPLQQVVSTSAAQSAEAAMRGRGVMSVRQGASIEERVAFLLARDQDAQGKMNALTERVEDLEEATPRQLDRLREDRTRTSPARLPRRSRSTGRSASSARSHSPSA